MSGGKWQGEKAGGKCLEGNLLDSILRLHTGACVNVLLLT